MEQFASREKPGLVSQLMGFSQIFWIANTMEMFERLAYYGLRTVLPIYMVLSIEEGGPQFSHTDKGLIYAWWATVQSGLPVFTGGFADKYGYKPTVAISIAVKIVGYVIMAFAVPLAAFFNESEITQAADPTVFFVFAAGALALAAGTAIFKPGLQGILGHQLNEHNSSLGWSVFYQLVNVGGFLGPFLAGWMRLLAWKWVFISCAIIVSLNYIFLFMFKEPTQQATDNPPATPEGLAAHIKDFFKVIWESFIGICEPRLMGFLVAFSGFWAMFYQLFDLLPNYITDWVDSRALLAIFTSNPPAEWHGHLPQEYMVNLNAGMCMTLAFGIGFLTGKVRSMHAMMAGMLVASAAIYGLGVSLNGWIVLIAIASFSIGELMSSPTKMRYFMEIAPPGKKGLYLGYINATGGIGWALGSVIAGAMYEEGGDKIVLARRHLVEVLGQDAASVAAMAKTAVLPRLTELTGQDVEQLRVTLFNAYDPSFVWQHFALIGVLSMVGLLAFDQITRRNLKHEAWAIVVLTGVISAWTYGLVPGLVFAGLILLYMGIEKLVPHWLPQRAGAA